MGFLIRAGRSGARWGWPRVLQNWSESM